ncbi:MAG: hypothetical protein GEU99_16090 [Luteitalea sp.]|nr:hypothetical protein [Luteitalea sp.]
MKQLFVSPLLLLAIAIPAAAQTGNGAPSGPHYNLNIIGVERGKNSDMTGSNRHTIFVALGRNGQVTSKIYLTRGEFAVCDGNAFDAAYDCAGQMIQHEGAVFQLPCNENLSEDGVDLVPCDDLGDTAAYEVYARALGQPNGSATITTCATDVTTGEVVCSAENVLLVRNKGQQTFSNVTNELTSLVANIDADPQFERVALFHDPFVDWFWQYDNRGLRLAQLRFYPIP